MDRSFSCISGELKPYMALQTTSKFQSRGSHAILVHGFPRPQQLDKICQDHHVYDTVESGICSRNTVIQGSQKQFDRLLHESSTYELKTDYLKLDAISQAGVNKVLNPPKLSAFETTMYAPQPPEVMDRPQIRRETNSRSELPFSLDTSNKHSFPSIRCFSLSGSLAELFSTNYIQNSPPTKVSHCEWCQSTAVTAIQEYQGAKLSELVPPIGTGDTIDLLLHLFIGKVWNTKRTRLLHNFLIASKSQFQIAVGHQIETTRSFTDRIFGFPLY